MLVLMTVSNLTQDKCLVPHSSTVSRRVLVCVGQCINRERGTYRTACQAPLTSESVATKAMKPFPLGEIAEVLTEHLPTPRGPTRETCRVPRSSLLHCEPARRGLRA